MSLDYLTSTLARYWRSVTLALLIVIASVLLATYLTPSMYTSSSTLFLSVRGAESASDLNQGGSYTERQVASYARVATSSMVLSPVISELGLAMTPEELARSVSVSSPAGTAILKISATWPTAEGAQAVADKIAYQLVASVAKLSPTSGNEPLVSATVTDPAGLPGEKSSPRVAQNVALGLLLALLLAVGQALLRQSLDNRVRRPHDVTDLTGLSVVAGISRAGAKQKKGYGYGYGYGAGASNEDFRRLRTNLRFLGLGTTRSPFVVVTSARAAEGKTHTSVGLARMVAEAGNRVLLIDADLRRPRVAETLQLDGAVGLSQVLSGQADLSDVIQKQVAGGFDVLPAGPIPPNPAELLGSGTMRRTLDRLKSHYDLVIFDSAPVLPVTDSVVLSELVGACLLVARAGVVTKVQLASAVQNIQAGGGDVLGVVLNDTDSGVQAYAAGLDTVDRSTGRIRRGGTRRMAG